MGLCVNLLVAKVQKVLKLCEWEYTGALAHQDEHPYEGSSSPLSLYKARVLNCIFCTFPVLRITTYQVMIIIFIEQVITCNNDVITVIYYFAFLCIIDPCTKCRLIARHIPAQKQAKTRIVKQ